MKTYSEDTCDVYTVKRIETGVAGLAYDIKNRKIYYSNFWNIGRVNVDGTGDETLFDSEGRKLNCQDLT